jgi:hypothetical protein
VLVKKMLYDLKAGEVVRVIDGPWAGHVGVVVWNHLGEMTVDLRGGSRTSIYTECLVRFEPSGVEIFMECLC